MFRSIKSQIIVAISLIIIVVLGATAYLSIKEKTKEISQDIFSNALSFSELTNERIIVNYENNYKQEAFAHFDREMADIYSLNEDISSVSIFDYSGKILYEKEKMDKISDEDLERIQAVYPSVKTNKNRVIYLDNSENQLRFTDLNGRSVQAVSDAERIENIIFPFKDQSNINRNYSLFYRVNYDSLFARVRATAERITVIAIVGILIALFIGYLLANGITHPIKSLTKGALQIGSGDFKTRIHVKSKSEVGMLADTFNKMAEDLEKSTEAKIEREKLAKELELAAKIQKQLLPKTIPKIKNIDIFASLTPATEVGGDGYDLIPIQENGNLLFYIADVTGHGVGAGLVSAINNALVPTLMNYYDNTKDIVINLNKILKAKTAPNIFVTSVMAIWDVSRSVLQFTQAGHDPILHYKAKSNQVVELAHGGMALGMLDSIADRIQTEEIQSEEGDIFILYTDGIPEAWKSDEENYGMERLKASIQKYAQESTAQEIHDGILKDLHEFMGDFPQADDITLIVIKHKNETV